ncbi:hypothetical protein TUMEXPCC7403_07735 [Tumidithrix helvetica PCC 7403]|uniref:STAS domain-containing protein n=1 Tax=Tumidithrix helvetica TaxID=3457545 RepID=UPI003CB508E1
MEKKVQVFRPNGKMNHDNCKEIYDQIQTLSKTEDFDYFIIDMQDVTYINTYGLGAVLGALRLSRQFGFRLILCSIIAEPVKSFFQLTAMDRVFNIYSNISEFHSTCSRNQ